MSSGQPSANPRAVKEALLLAANEYEVIFIYCPISAWADEFDRELFRNNPRVKWVRVGCHPVQNKWGYRYARLRKKIYSKLIQLMPGSHVVNIRAYVLFSQELEQEAIKHKAGLYISHNLGAIRAAVKAAKKYGAKAGFDAEDFHRGEFTANDSNQKITTVIEDQYFPQLDYCTAASPLIGEAYAAIYAGRSFVTVNNVFSKAYLNATAPREDQNGLDLFWFSQFVGPKRGIEQIIDAMNICGRPDIRLHLLGNIREEYKNELLKRAAGNNIIFMPPVAPEKIFSIARNFDIGLASEIPETLNREYCLTNKIFTYLLAGNCLLLSATKAQARFLDEHPGIGIKYDIGDPVGLAQIIQKLYADRVLLKSMRSCALKTAEEKLNWEKEGEIFITIVRNMTAADHIN